MTSAICGSSPHTRGTHRLDVRGLVRARFIPAYAGNTRSGAASPSARTVHPRIRGERMVTIAVRSGSVGSSPHTRGTQPLLRGGRPCARVIPVYAGNAQATTTGPYLPDGSSPHARGTLEEAPDLLAPLRFIPAYAGNARAGHQPMRGLTVHPRIRGERQPLSRQYSSAAGSSPHTRGTHDPRRAAWRRCRFIPAYAGNALALHAGTSSAAVHPRIRGERRVCVASCSTTFGSSPHTRGTPHGSNH